MTVILPKAAGKQRFLRLTPAFPSKEKALEGEFLPREAIFLFPLAFGFAAAKSLEVDKSRVLFMKTKTYRIGMVLVASLLAVVLPQQNARGDIIDPSVIDTPGVRESGDATLSDLRLSGITLTPAFSPEKTYYTAWVDNTATNAITSTTVTATPNHSAATVEILWGPTPLFERNANRGRQVTLQEVTILIVVDVISANGLRRGEGYFIYVEKSATPPPPPPTAEEGGVL